MAKKRININEMDENQIADYIHALNILRARSEQNPDDENGYNFQAGLHNDPFIGPCEHGNDLFLAWHRAHLHYFEKLLQEADPPRTANVTIPYWDWIHGEESGKFPAAFARPGLFMSDRNNMNTQLPTDTLQIVTQETNWNEFGGFPKSHPTRNYGRLELGPHNYMHSDYIGGRMADPITAAEDPIYWSFHAFVDLLWAEWQRRNNMPSPTTPDGDLRGFLTKPKHKVRDFQKTTDLDYEYEYTIKLNQVFGVTQLEHVRLELLATQSLLPIFSAGLGSEFRRASRAQFSLPSPPHGTTSAFLRLKNLKVPTSGSYIISAYVHPKEVLFNKDDPEFQKRYGIGYVALWKSHGSTDTHGGHSDHGHGAPPAHHPNSCTARFDMSKQLTEILGTVSELIITLQYIPAPTPTGEAPANPDLVKEVQLDEVILEAYAQS